MNEIEEETKSEMMGRLNVFLTLLMVFLVIAYSAVLFFDVKSSNIMQDSDVSVTDFVNTDAVDCQNLDVNNSGDIDLAELEFLKENFGKTCL